MAALEAALALRHVGEDRVSVALVAPEPRFWYRPLVSIIIPTRDQQPMLSTCLKSITRSNYDNYEILIVENNSQRPATFSYYEQLKKQPANELTLGRRFSAQPVRPRISSRVQATTVRRGHPGLLRSRPSQWR